MVDFLDDSEFSGEVDIDLESRFESAGEEEVVPHGGVEREASRVEGAMERSSAESDSAYGSILSRVQTQTVSDEDQAHISQDASEAHQHADRESQLQHLVDLAVTKGIDHSVHVAEQLGDYYMLDQLHDTLLHDDLHRKLVESGVLDVD